MTAEESAALKADAEARTADANARKADYEADKSKAETEAAIAKAKLGGLTDVSESATTATNNAGTIEATVLAAGEARKAASNIVTELCAKRPVLCHDPAEAEGTAPPDGLTVCDDLTYHPAPGPPKLYIYSESERPAFDAAETVQAALCGVRLKLNSAIKKSVGDSTVSAVGAFTLAATALKFLRTDFAISGLTVPTDDWLLAKLVLAEDRIKVPVHIPSLYRNAALSQQSPLMVGMVDLSKLRSEAARRAAGHRAEAARLGKKKGAKEHSDKAASLDEAIKAHDDYLAKITTPSDKGVTDLAEAARLSQIRQDLANGSFLLTLKMNAAGGSGYTKKNVWSFLGGPAFFVSGGAETSYTFWDGKSGRALRANEHGSVSDFHRIGHLPETK